MKINEAIKLMKSLTNIKIDQLSANRYRIYLKEYDDEFKRVVCFIDGDRIEYCLDDLYNNGCDCEQIDFEQLNELQQFVKMLQNIGD